MSVVNVRLTEIFAAPADVPVTVKFVSVEGAMVVANQMGVRPGLKTARTDATGLAAFTLSMGRYEITAPIVPGAEQFKVRIDVPNDSNTYEFAELIVDPTLFDPEVGGESPNATADVYGLVRLSSGGGGIPETFNTITLLKALTSAKAAIAKVAFVFGGAAVDDGLGGIYRWDAAGVEDDEGIGGRVARPNDFSGAGNWKKFI